MNLFKLQEDFYVAALQRAKEIIADNDHPFTDNPA